VPLFGYNRKVFGWVDQIHRVAEVDNVRIEKQIVVISFGDKFGVLEETAVQVVLWVDYDFVAKSFWPRLVGHYAEVDVVR